MDNQDLRRRRVLRVYDGFRAVGIMDDDFDLAAEVYRAVQRQGHTIRSQLESGKTPQYVIASWQPNEREFRGARAPYLLY